ncbi:hypothetical protein D554_0196 [Bordetella holmesii 30539]|nr:hypothetical protein D556_0197 [Bordetella holmesii 41130]EXF90389.1 hypothetical protein D554_0196 [Bordetella holmesii 30539]CFN76663.1 Uncharacterised protein [Bordetella pertussis]CFP67444.1 Uncharacterised protein [Bordetella pertussis]
MNQKRNPRVPFFISAGRHARIATARNWYKRGRGFSRVSHKFVAFGR